MEAEELNPAPIVTIYCVTDLNSVHGRAQVKQALNFLSSNLDARVSFIHNPTTFAWPSHKYDLSELMYLLLAGGALQDVLPIELSAWLDLNIGEAGLPLLADLFMEDDPILPYLKGAERSEIQAAITFWQSLRGTVEKFGFLPGASGLVINGRVIGPMEVIFSEKDFESLKNFELKERISPVVEALKEIGFELSSNPDDR